MAHCSSLIGSRSVRCRVREAACRTKPRSRCPAGLPGRRGRSGHPPAAYRPSAARSGCTWPSPARTASPDRPGPPPPSTTPDPGVTDCSGGPPPRANGCPASAPELRSPLATSLAQPRPDPPVAAGTRIHTAERRHRLRHRLHRRADRPARRAAHRPRPRHRRPRRAARAQPRRRSRPAGRRPPPGPGARADHARLAGGGPAGRPPRRPRRGPAARPALRRRAARGCRPPTNSPAAAATTTWPASPPRCPRRPRAVGVLPPRRHRGRGNRRSAPAPPTPRSAAPTSACPSTPTGIPRSNRCSPPGPTSAASPRRE